MRATERCWDALDEPPDDAHALIGVLQCLEHAPPDPRGPDLLDRVRVQVPTARWLALEVPFDGYAVTPIDLAPHSDALARTRFDDTTIEAHLDAIAAQQQPDIGWPLTWSPPDGAVAEWRGKRTLDAIAILHAYGHL